MSNEDLAISVRGLSKSFKIKHRMNQPTSFAELISQRLRHPFGGNSEEVETFWALKDVSFDIHRGEVLGIIGRNGAGKSSLLKILSRITDPTAGEIDIHGRVASLLEVGTGFHPELTGRENIYLNGAILGMTRREITARFDEIVAFAEVERFLDTPVKRYSSGMYVRLAFAVAAHLEPEILIVDEVLAVGDAAFQKKCIGKMKDVAGQGRTILFVSHSLASIQRLCTRAALFSRGSLIADGDVSHVTASYVGEAENSAHQWVRVEPAKSSIYFERVALCDGDGATLAVVPTSGSLHVRLEFVVKEKHSGLMVSVGLLDQYGEHILESSPQDDSVENPNSIGRHVYTVEFPEDILMPKPYELCAVLWDRFQGDHDRVDGIRFNVTDMASLANSVSVGRAGLLALRCGWSAENA